MALRLFSLVASAPTPAPEPEAAVAAGTSSYWVSSIQRRGTVPFGDSSFQVFRNVKDFGAKGDGEFMYSLIRYLLVTNLD